MTQQNNDLGTATVCPDGAGGFVVQQDLDGHLRTYGGFSSEEEARACLARGERAEQVPSGA